MIKPQQGVAGYGAQGAPNLNAAVGAKTGMKKALPYIIFAVVLAIILGWVGMLGRLFWFEDVYATHGKNQVNRDAMTALHEKIEAGDDWQQVFSKYYATRSDGLSLHCDSESFWLVTMPMEFSAHDWRLEITFTNGRASHVRVRTTDGPKPENSPPDK